jgi:hypothetical protein
MAPDTTFPGWPGFPEKGCCVRVIHRDKRTGVVDIEVGLYVYQMNPIYEATHETVLRVLTRAGLTLDEIEHLLPGFCERYARMLVKEWRDGH